MKEKNAYTPSDSMKMFFFGIALFLVISYTPVILLGDRVKDFPIYWIISAAGSLSFLLASFIKSRADGISFAKSVKLDTPIDKRNILPCSVIVIASMLVTMPLVLLYSLLLQKIGYTPSPEVGMGTTADIIAAFLVMGLIAPVTEEIFIRGVVANGFKALGRIKGAVLTGFLFMIMHMNPSQVIHQFFIGVLLTWIFYRTASLKATILMHMLNNILALVFNFLPENILLIIFGGYFFITMPIGIFLLVFFLRRIRKREDIESVNEENNTAADMIYSPVKTKVMAVDVILFMLGIFICVFLWAANLLL